MNLEDLKRLAKKVGGVVVINGDNPEFVILTYDKFKELLLRESDGIERPAYVKDRDINGLDQDQSEIERLNQEILVLKEEIRQRESAELALSENEELGVSEAVGPALFVD